MGRPTTSLLLRPRSSIDVEVAFCDNIHTFSALPSPAESPFPDSPPPPHVPPKVLVPEPLLADQMFQFAKFEKSKERRLAIELRYGFPIRDPWITDGISPWPFAFESLWIFPCADSGVFFFSLGF
ncbi:hypothetical protein Tco_1206201 [Tanacetum coccineum]